MTRRGKLKFRKEYLPSDSWEYLKLKKRIKLRNEKYQKLKKQIKLLTSDHDTFSPTDNQSINAKVTSNLKSNIDSKNSIKKLREMEKRRIRRRTNTVCFRCRQSGHKISDCPNNTGQSEKNTIQCFICNSKNHNSSKCPRNKVGKGEITEYKYACCFVCKEQGHIANQCPKNPNGIYPRGGSCRTCGSKFHKQGECPLRASAKQGPGGSVTGEERLNIMDINSRDDDTRLEHENANTNYNQIKVEHKIVNFR